MGFDTDRSYLSIHAYVQNTQIQMLTDDDSSLCLLSCLQPWNSKLLMLSGNARDKRIFNCFGKLPPGYVLSSVCM